MIPAGQRVYRPLRGGIAIQNPVVKNLGTLGCVATSDGADRWIVSCYHVLCRLNGVFPPGATEPICQPYDIRDPNPVAFISDARIDAILDCAAALVPNGAAIGEILGISKLSAPIPAITGMRVIKSGAETGITEGRVVSVAGNEVEIAPLGLPADYDLSEGGDSGAIWIDAASNAPIALHYKGSEWGTPTRAFGKSMTAVLNQLNLRLLVA